MNKISCFTDCDSETMVLRIPYKTAIDMVNNLPVSDERAELIKWITRQKSVKLRKLIPKSWREDNDR